MKKLKSVFMIICCILLVGCSSEDDVEVPKIAMPYGSREYISGEWTNEEWSVEDLVKQFEGLGFTEIEIIGNTTKVISVTVEGEDGLFDSFYKGEEVEISRKIHIFTAFEATPPLTVSNCPEFAEFVENGIESSKNSQAWVAFLKSHSGELLVFDGTITDWYDEAFWIGVSFTIAIEDSPNMSFSKDTMSLSELGMTGEYDYNNYYAGLIKEGVRVHVVTEITKTDDGWWDLELDSIQVIE